MPDGMPLCKSFSSVFDTCEFSTSSSDLAITQEATYSTLTGMLTIGGVVSTPAHVVVMTSTGQVDVLLVNNFSLSAVNFTIVGPRPFAIAARGNITISGVLNVTPGEAGSRSGAGCAALPPGSTSAGGIGAVGTDGAGGGGGGGFHGLGGAGGEGDSEQNNARPAGGLGGNSIARPSGPRGGCNGGNGGNGDGPTGGIGGLGGGAVVIATPKTLAISGTINVGGGGGGGGKTRFGGGGGGGAGGMMVLECKALELTGQIVANGGGGGEGAGSREVSSGNPGSPGLASASPAPGGSGGSGTGANGGTGGAGTSNNGSAPTTVLRGGGGGGGGGTGYIAIACPGFTPPSGAVISPAFAAWP